MFGYSQCESIKWLIEVRFRLQNGENMGIFHVGT